MIRATNTRFLAANQRSSWS